MAISDFTSSFSNLARPTLFDVSSIQVPSFVSGLDNVQFHAKATSIPTSNLGIIPVGYQGRKIKIPGDRTYDEWTVTFYNDVGWNIRDAFESWHNAISAPESIYGEPILDNIFGSFSVAQKNNNNETIKTYTLEKAFPSVVGEIALDWDSNDAVETFDVTIAYSYFTSA